MGGIARGARAAESATRAADGIRKLSQPPQPKSAAGAAGKAMAQKSEPALSVGVARQLAYGTDSDRAQLRAIVETLSPQAKDNLVKSIAGEMRDPRSPAKGISLTPEGDELVGIIFRGDQPSPERMAEIARVGENASPRLADIPVGEDLSPKGPPAKPKSEQSRELQKEPKFRSKEKVVEGKDGTLQVKQSSVSLDRDTARAIERAKNGERVGPIYDDPKNAPEWAASSALRSGTRSPLQETTQKLNRLAGLRDPSQGTHAGSVASDEVSAEVPMSVFMPSIQSSPAGGSMATMKPQDYADAMDLFRIIRRGDNRVPNTQFESPEEMARALVASVDQGGYDATPVTGSQRRAATEMLEDSMFDPEGAPIDYGRSLTGGDIPPGQMSEAQAGRMMRQNMPAEAKAASTAQRAVVQEQVIESLARKLNEVFGREGWGADYTPSVRPASADPAAPPGGVGEGVASSGYEPSGIAPKNPGLPGRPGMELDPDLDMEDLENLDAVRRSLGEGDPLPDGEAESIVTSGRAQGDKTGVTPSKARAEGGNKPGEYEDPDQSFAEFNRLNRTATKGELKDRNDFYETWKRAVELESSPTAQLRRELQELTEGPLNIWDRRTLEIAPGTKADNERLAQIADLQRRIALAERLDQMSGIKTFPSEKPKKGKKTATKPAADSVDGTPEAGALVPVRKPDPFDLNGRPHNPADEIIDAEFEIKANTPEAPATPAPAAQAKPSWWSRLGKAAAITAAGGLGYTALRRASEPPVPPGGYGNGTDGMNDPFGPGGGGSMDGGYPPYPPIPPYGSDVVDGTGVGGGAGLDQLSPADRIRMLQRGMPFMLNPNTQTIQSWTR